MSAGLCTLNTQEELTFNLRYVREIHRINLVETPVLCPSSPCMWIFYGGSLQCGGTQYVLVRQVSLEVAFEISFLSNRRKHCSKSCVTSASVAALKK